MEMHARSWTLLALALGCGGGKTPDGTVPTAATAMPSASATPNGSVASAPDAGKPPDASSSPACAALDQERAAENALLKASSESKDPLKRMASLEESERAMFTSCQKTKSGGAWGLGLKDLKAENNGTTAQLVVFHADAKGQKTQLVLKGHSDRTHDRAFAVNDKDHVSFESVRLFDYDGDGEEELVLIGHDQTHEGPRDPEGTIVTFKGGACAVYPPLKDVVFWRVEDNDKDGRLDLVTYGSYRSRIGARCNGATSVAQGPALLVHSLPDGSFSMSDASAVAFAKATCEKPGFAVSRDEEKRVDDEQTFVNLACARLWGMSDAQASGLVAQSCTALSGDATCSEGSLKSCVYPAVLRQWSKATPPLTIH
jgi:hypothetical protein